MRSQSHESWLRTLTTQELHDRLEMVGWDRAELEDERASRADIYESARDYFDFLLSSFNTEIGRRARLRDQFAVNRTVKTSPMGRERFDAVKRAVPITTLLWDFGAGSPLPAGNRQIMSCPLGLHDDSTPSFTIYPGDAGWYCFGCNQGGSVIDLAMLLLRTNDPRVALDHVEGIAREIHGLETNVAVTLARIDGVLANAT